MVSLLGSVAFWLLEKVGLGGIAASAGEVFNTVRGAIIGDAKIGADVETHRIDAEVENRKTEAGLQTAKMQFPLFWMIAIAFLFPLLFKWWAINFYDVLWCKDCVFHQRWTIAAYQAPFDAWAASAFSWVFGPVGAAALAGGVGVALATRRR